MTKFTVYKGPHEPEVEFKLLKRISLLPAIGLTLNSFGQIKMAEGST